MLMCMKTSEFPDEYGVYIYKKSGFKTIFFLYTYYDVLMLTNAFQ